MKPLELVGELIAIVLFYYFWCMPQIVTYAKKEEDLMINLLRSQVGTYVQDLAKDPLVSTNVAKPVARTVPPQFRKAFQRKLKESMATEFANRVKQYRKQKQLARVQLILKGRTDQLGEKLTHLEERIHREAAARGKPVYNIAKCLKRKVIESVAVGDQTLDEIDSETEDDKSDTRFDLLRHTDKLQLRITRFFKRVQELTKTYRHIKPRTGEATDQAGESDEEIYKFGRVGNEDGVDKEASDASDVELGLDQIEKSHFDFDLHVEEAKMTQDEEELVEQAIAEQDNDGDAKADSPDAQDGSLDRRASMGMSAEMVDAILAADEWEENGDEGDASPRGSQSARRVLRRRSDIESPTDKDEDEDEDDNEAVRQLRAEWYRRRPQEGEVRIHLQTTSSQHGGKCEATAGEDGDAADEEDEPSVMNLPRTTLKSTRPQPNEDRVDPEELKTVVPPASPTSQSRRKVVPVEDLELDVLTKKDKDGEERESQPMVGRDMHSRSSVSMPSPLRNAALPTTLNVSLDTPKGGELELGMIRPVSPAPSSGSRRGSLAHLLSPSGVSSLSELERKLNSPVGEGRDSKVIMTFSADGPVMTVVREAQTPKGTKRRGSRPSLTPSASEASESGRDAGGSRLFCGCWFFRAGALQASGLRRLRRATRFPGTTQAYRLACLAQKH